MNRYLIIVLLFLATHVFAQQNSYNKSYKKIDLFSKFDEKLTFGLSDSEIKLFFKDALGLNNLNFEEEGYRYFLSVSHGWKKNKSEPYKVNNFKGLSRWYIDIAKRPAVIKGFKALNESAVIDYP